MLSSLAVAALALAQTAPQESQWPARNLKVLYAGAPGDLREERFMEFLERWFERVDPIPLGDLDEKSAARYDVVIADWKRQYKDGMPVDGAEPSYALPASFTKPVILIGATAGTIQHHSKIDWL